MEGAWLRLGPDLDRCRVWGSCLRGAAEGEEGCKPASSSLDSGSVCAQVSGVCAGAGGQVGQVGQMRSQAWCKC